MANPLETIGSWLRAAGLLESSEIDSSRIGQQDFSWVTQPGGVETLVEQGLRSRGLPTRGRLADHWARALSRIDPELLFNIYSTADASAAGEEGIGQFLHGYVGGIFDPSLGQQIGFAPALTGAQAIGLLSEALNPESQRAIAGELELALREGDDSQMFQLITNVVVNVGALAFSRRRLESITNALEQVYRDFLDLKYNQGRLAADATFFDYLAEHGAFYLKHFLPGVDWSQLANLVQRPEVAGQDTPAAETTGAQVTEGGSQPTAAEPTPTTPPTGSVEESLSAMARRDDARHQARLEAQQRRRGDSSGRSTTSGATTTIPGRLELGTYTPEPQYQRTGSSYLAPADPRFGLTRSWLDLYRQHQRWR